MAEELKPCPFLSCGSKDVRWFSAPSFEDECESDYYVACAKCGASGPIRAKRKDAIAEWDARAEPERHVLGVGFVIAETDWAGQDDVAMVGISDGAGNEEEGPDMITLDWPDTLKGRYRLVLEKVPADG